jgi:hypothetical protein
MRAKRFLLQVTLIVVLTLASHFVLMWLLKPIIPHDINWVFAGLYVVLFIAFTALTNVFIFGRHHRDEQENGN